MTEFSAAAAPRVVCFDVGEVLIDETRVWSLWADLIGVSPLTFAAVLGAAIVQGEEPSAVFPHLAPNVDWRSLENDHEAIYGGFVEADLYADVRPVLGQLRADGLKIVISGNQPARRTPQLQALDLPCDALAMSEDLGVEKPSQGFFEAVCALADAAPAQVLYVGDRIDNDVLPAAAAGLRTCWLQRGPWGQLQEAPDDIEPDIVLEGLGELPELLRAWQSGDLDHEE